MINVLIIGGNRFLGLTIAEAFSGECFLFKRRITALFYAYYNTGIWKMQ